MYDNMNDHDHRLIKAAYWAMVDLIDKQVGRLLDYLDKSCLLYTSACILCEV